MAHSKRRRTEHKKNKNRATQSMRAGKKVTLKKKTKEYWTNDEKYQEEQKERLERLKKHPKYQQNINEGIRRKEQNKKEKARAKEMKEKQKRRHT